MFCVIAAARAGRAARDRRVFSFERRRAVRVDCAVLPPPLAADPAPPASPPIGPVGPEAARTAGQQQEQQVQTDPKYLDLERRLLQLSEVVEAQAAAAAEANRREQRMREELLQREQQHLRELTERDAQIRELLAPRTPVCVDGGA